jgi:hypothetical protein
MAVLMFVSLFGASIPACAQLSAATQTCPVHFQITDEDGAAIEKAFVLIHSDRASKISQQVPLDHGGKSRINLRPGLYDLFVSSPGFMPIAEVVDLRSCKPLNVNLMMTIDSEHMESNF